MENLSQSSTARIENLRLDPTAKSDDSFIERMDVDIIENRASILSDQNDCSDFTCKDTVEIDNGYSRVETKNKIDNKNQKVNTKKLFKQLSNSRVVLKRLPDSIISQKLQPTDSSKLIIENENINTVDVVTGATVIDSLEFKTMTTRYCSKCEVVEPNVNSSSNKPCRKCGTPLDYQCLNCYSAFTVYSDLNRHLRKKSCKIAKVDPDSENELKPVEMMKRYCSKCKAVDPNVNVSTKKSCTKCGKLLIFQCVYCYKVYSHYRSLTSHLEGSCSLRKRKVRNNIRYKCNKCSFKTSHKCSLSRHLNYYHSLDEDKSEDDISTYAGAVDVPIYRAMMTRYCSKCEVVGPNVNISTNKPCRKCRMPLDYQCRNCYSTFTVYSDLNRHLREKSCKIAKVDPDSENELKPVEMMKRYCSKCKAVDPNVTVCTKKSCTKCGNPLHFQCVYCYKVYPHYRSLTSHLESSCSLRKRKVRNNIRYKCNKCSFETSHKCSLKRHLSYYHSLDEDKSEDDISTYAEAVNVPIYREMMTRYCAKCEVVKPNVNISTNRSCKKCGTPFDYQCLNCYSVFTMYSVLNRHLRENSCKIPKGNLKTSSVWYKCNKCSFRAPYKSSLKRHSVIHLSLNKDTKQKNISTDAKAVNVPISRTMMTRYCTKCEAVEPNVNISSTKPCKKCGKPVCYQCVSCSRLFPFYTTLQSHIKKSCGSQKESVKNGNKCNK